MNILQYPWLNSVVVHMNTANLEHLLLLQHKIYQKAKYNACMELIPHKPTQINTKY